MRRIRSSIFLVLASVQLLAPLPAALAGDGFTEEELRQAEAQRAAFFDSSYTFCDADALAAAWGQSVDEAKAQIGWKLTEGSRDILERDLSMARTAGLELGSTCYFYERGGFTYEDAETLGIYWGVSVAEAKAQVSFKLGEGDVELVRNELDAANTMVEKAARNAELDPNEGLEDGTALIIAEEQRLDAEAYFASAYSYCDAQLLAQAWQIAVDEAKASIGHKLRNGDAESIDAALLEVRVAARARGEHCYLDYELPVSDRELELIAARWKVAVAEARDRLDDMIAQRRTDAVSAELAAVRALLGEQP